MTRPGSLTVSLGLAFLLDTVLIVLAARGVQSRVLDLLFWPGESAAKLLYSGFHSIAPLLFAAAVNCVCYSLVLFFVIVLSSRRRA